MTIIGSARIDEIITELKQKLNAVIEYGTPSADGYHAISAEIVLKYIEDKERELCKSVQQE